MSAGKTADTHFYVKNLKQGTKYTFTVLVLDNSGQNGVVAASAATITAQTKK